MEANKKQTEQIEIAGMVWTVAQALDPIDTDHATIATIRDGQIVQVPGLPLSEFIDNLDRRNDAATVVAHAARRIDRGEVLTANELEHVKRARAILATSSCTPGRNSVTGGQ
jgi:hypothetical protein